MIVRAVYTWTCAICRAEEQTAGCEPSGWRWFWLCRSFSKEDESASMQEKFLVCKTCRGDEPHTAIGKLAALKIFRWLFVKEESNGKK